MGLWCSPGVRADQSDLWGAAGEKWMPGAPLKDFSTAGYKKSDAPIPDFPVGVNVRDFGAKGDGTTDDAPAFAKAVAACPPNTAVYVPDGTYVLRDWVRVTRNDLALRGQSQTGTILSFPVGLQEVHPNMGATTTHNPTTNWSWSGGFIWFETATNVGVENFTLKFPDVPYPGHFKEIGSNGVEFHACHDGWARNLSIYNADSGVFVENSANVTVRHVDFDAFPGRASAAMCGHHGVDYVTSDHCLTDGVVFHVRFLHELGIEHGANLNVYMNSAGPDLHLDHHQTDSHDNLWTNIDTGVGHSVWQNNAHVLLKSRAGSTAGEVFWNVRARGPLPLPETKFKNIIVGMSTTDPAVREPDGAWYEPIDPAKLTPPNIFEAQLARRQGGKVK